MATILQVLRPGERTNSEGHPLKNRLLLRLPDNEFRMLRSRLRFVKLPHHLSLHEPNRKLEYLYFLNEGMISLVVGTENGRTVEVGVVGHEGAGCLPCVVNLKTSPVREQVQIAGEGFRIEAAALHSCLKSAPHLRELLNRYAVLQTLQVAQTAACNRLHEIRQRLARWLLLTQDRVPSGYLPITHDFLATMLGSDRPSVTLAARWLQKRGAIRYLRGAVRIVNRRALENCACECYAAMQQFNGELGLT
jgi:CRP-like cAMP-binding protein